MTSSTERLIAWFWEVAPNYAQEDPRYGICQCGTERIISESGNPPRTRAFFLASVAIDQAMKAVLDAPDYEIFAQQFRFPRIRNHGGDGCARADWVVYSHYGWDKEMDWQLGASIFCQLTDDLRIWSLKRTGGEYEFLQFLLRLEWLILLFEKYDKEASESIRRYLAIE
jgi:hypothetical protein